MRDMASSPWMERDMGRCNMAWASATPRSALGVLCPMGTTQASDTLLLRFVHIIVKYDANTPRASRPQERPLKALGGSDVLDALIVDPPQIFATVPSIPFRVKIEDAKVRRECRAAVVLIGVNKRT